MNSIILAVALFVIAPAGLEEDLRFLQKVNPIETRTHEAEVTPGFSLRQTSELRLALTGLVRVYQILVSPQGPPGCNFTLSCSRFMSRAVRDFGPWHGLLMTGDRLQRCVHSGRGYYLIDVHSGKAIDYPARAYYLGTKNRIHEAGE